MKRYYKYNENNVVRSSIAELFPLSSTYPSDKVVLLRVQ